MVKQEVVVIDRIPGIARQEVYLAEGSPGGGGGPEEPMETQVYPVPAGVTDVTGTPTGTVQMDRYTDRIKLTFAVTAASAWGFRLPFGGAFVAPDAAYWTSDTGSGSAIYSSPSVELVIDAYSASYNWSEIMIYQIEVIG
jgi:hypothetical protein